MEGDAVDAAATGRHRVYVYLHYLAPRLADLRSPGIDLWFFTNDDTPNMTEQTIC